MQLNKIHIGDCIEGMKLLPDCCIDCCVTSPPYYGLRDYGNEAQIGLESTPELYVLRMVEVFEEVRRVLKANGTLWLNMGDSYAGSGKGMYDSREDKKKQATNAGSIGVVNQNFKTFGLKPKDLIGIPWMLAFALRSAGWYLRQDIIWHKPNPMPESVTDRCTKAHEYIFLFSKSREYYYDAESIKTPIADSTVQRMLQDIENQNGSDRVPGKTNGPMKAVMSRNPRIDIDTRGGNQASANGIPTVSRKGNGIDNTDDINGNGVKGHIGYFDARGNIIGNGMANKKSVWTVTTKPFKGAHFATFPQELIIPCIKAGSKRGGVILDPFMGAGTTALVAKKLERNYIGYELNSTYVQIAENRLSKELGLFA